MKLIFLFVVICLLTGSVSIATPVPTATSAITTTGTPASGPFTKSLPTTMELGKPSKTVLVEDTEHCTIYYPEGEQASASFIGIVLEDHFETFGKDILAEWVKTPRDSDRVFGVSAETFEKHWRSWLVDNYMEE